MARFICTNWVKRGGGGRGSFGSGRGPFQPPALPAGGSASDARQISRPKTKEAHPSELKTGQKSELVIKVEPRPEYRATRQSGYHIQPWRRPNEECKGVHSVHRLGVETCLPCQVHCNCDGNTHYPDVLLRSLDGQDVKVSSFVVAGSYTLREAVHARREKARMQWITINLPKLESTLGLGNVEKRGEKRKIDSTQQSEAAVIDLCSDSDDDEVTIIQEKRSKIEKEEDIFDVDSGAEIRVVKLKSDDEEELITISDSDSEDAPAQSSSCKKQQYDEEFEKLKERARREFFGTEIPDLFEFPQNAVLDLRDGDKILFGITAAQWSTLERFMSLHLDEVDERVSAQRRSIDFEKKIRLTIVDTTSIYSRFWSYSDWEEDFFRNMPHQEFLDLFQVHEELIVIDFHFSLLRWLFIWQGVPPIEDFGWNIRFIEEFKREKDKVMLRKFVERQPFRKEKGRRPRKKLPPVASLHGRLPDRTSMEYSKVFWRKRHGRKY